MKRRIQVWLFVELVHILKPEVALWKLDGDIDSMDEVDPGKHDVRSIVVDNGRYAVTYDTYVSARAKAHRRRADARKVSTH